MFKPKDTALVIGAGAVGRGALAPLLLRNQLQVVFFDTNRELVAALQGMKGIPLYQRVNQRAPEVVEPVKAFTYIPPGLVPDVICVSVGVENFPEVARVLVNCAHNELWRDVHRAEFPVLVCENTPDAGGKLEDWVRRQNAPWGMPVHFSFHSVIAECVIPEPTNNFVLPGVYYDPTAHFILDNDCLSDDFGREIYLANGFSATDFFFDSWQAKWLLHCGLHLVVGVLGVANGFNYVHQAVGGHHRLATELRNFALYLAERIPTDSAFIRKHFRARAELEIKQLSSDERPDRCERLIRNLARKMRDADERFQALVAVMPTEDVTLRKVAEQAQILINQGKG